MSEPRPLSQKKLMQIRTRAWITGNDEVKADTMRLISELRSLWKAARNTLQYFKGSVGFSERTRNTIKWRPDFVAIVEEMEALLPPEEPECLESLLKEAKHVEPVNEVPSAIPAKCLTETERDKQKASDKAILKIPCNHKVLNYQVHYNSERHTTSVWCPECATYYKWTSEADESENLMLDRIRSSLKEYPNVGGDIIVMQEVERIVQKSHDEAVRKIQEQRIQLIARFDGLLSPGPEATEVIRGKIHELEFALAALGVKEETDVKMASNSTIEPTGSRT